MHMRPAAAMRLDSASIDSIEAPSMRMASTFSFVVFIVLSSLLLLYVYTVEGRMQIYIVGDET